MSKRKTCRWVVQPAADGKPAEYCGANVRYTLVEDGGEPGAPKVRQYKSFCEEHLAKAQGDETVEDALDDLADNATPIEEVRRSLGWTREEEVADEVASIEAQYGTGDDEEIEIDLTPLEVVESIQEKVAEEIEHIKADLDAAKQEAADQEDAMYAADAVATEADVDYVEERRKRILAHLDRQTA